jgi:hypothetical protein
VARSISPAGPWQSAGGFETQNITNIASYTERMKNITIIVCAKTAFVG